MNLNVKMSYLSIYIYICIYVYIVFQNKDRKDFTG